jgi:hypothetical protein
MLRVAVALAPRPKKDHRRNCEHDEVAREDAQHPIGVEQARVGVLAAQDQRHVEAGNDKERLHGKPAVANFTVAIGR